MKKILGLLLAGALISSVMIGCSGGDQGGDAKTGEPAKENKMAPAAEPAKTDAAKTEPAKTEPAKTEPAKTEPAKTEPAKTEPAKGGK